MSDHTTETLINSMIGERLTFRPPENWTGKEPNFGGIALELTYLDRLTEQGWWGAFSYCMYAEEVLRQFGPVVANAALVEGRHNGEMETANQAVLFAVLGYLRWLRTHEADEPILASIGKAEKPLMCLFDKLERRRAHQKLAAQRDNNNSQ